MTFDETREKYLNDAAFHALVHGLFDVLFSGRFTYLEAQDALRLAQLKNLREQDRRLVDRAVSEVAP